MKSIFKLLLVLSVGYLAACSVDADVAPIGLGNESLGSKPANIKDQAVQGSIGGVSWVSSKAIGVVQADGSLMVSIAGNDEVIDCNYTMPLKPSLLFTIPMAVGEHDFDMLVPNKGYAVTWSYKSGSVYHNIVSDMVHISVTSVSHTRLLGGLSAKFLDPSNSGLLNGKFDVTICR